MDTNSNNTKSIKLNVVDQLVQGYEFATQLQHLLSQSHQHNFSQQMDQNGVVSTDPNPIDELLVKILGTFNKTISILDSFDPLTVSIPNAVEGSRNASCGDDVSAAPASCNGGDSGDSRKRLSVGKGKRGCYIRKKRAHTWIVEARTIDEDGHSWRKYGQKEILNSKFPRSYFRCTHKPTQGCQAKRQVQKQEQDPEMFQITYTGYHTCNANEQTRAKIEPFDQEIIMDLDKTLATTTAKTNHINAEVQEQENNISSVTMVSTGLVKEEGTNIGVNKENCEASSTGEDLSLAWIDKMMFDDHQYHQSRYYCFDDHQYHQSPYYCGETSTNSHNFTFNNNDQLSSFFDPYYT